jgi:hypothetical protein
MKRIIDDPPPRLGKGFPKSFSKYVHLMLSKDPKKRRSVSHFLVRKVDFADILGKELLSEVRGEFRCDDPEFRAVSAEFLGGKQRKMKMYKNVM